MRFSAPSATNGPSGNVLFRACSPRRSRGAAKIAASSIPHASAIRALSVSPSALRTLVDADCWIILRGVSKPGLLRRLWVPKTRSGPGIRAEQRKRRRAI